MAGFARACHRAVDRSGGLARNAICRCQMARCTLRRQRYVHVKLSRTPAHIPTLVASITIGNHHTRQRLVRNVIDRFAIRGGVTAGVAGRALVRHRHLRMVPAAGFPYRQRRTMATHTVGCSRKVRTVFASGSSPVVASRANRRCGVSVVIGFRTQPCSRAGVAAFTVAGDSRVDRRSRFARGPVSCRKVTRSALRRHSQVCVNSSGIPR
jgi:hypothetical protein